MKRISSIALSAVTALGIAVSPAPAAADSNDIAKVLAGLAVLGIVAKVADDRRDRRKAAAAASTPYYGSIDHDGRIIDGELRRIDEPRAGKVRGYKKRPLPDRCLRVLENNRGRDRLVYANRCLNRNYQFASKLPEHCKRVIRTHRGDRVVFASRCLSRDGWRVARR